MFIKRHVKITVAYEVLSTSVFLKLERNLGAVGEITSRTCLATVDMVLNNKLRTSLCLAEVSESDGPLKAAATLPLTLFCVWVCLLPPPGPSGGVLGCGVSGVEPGHCQTVTVRCHGQAVRTEALPAL